MFNKGETLVAYLILGAADMYENDLQKLKKKGETEFLGRTRNN